MVGFLVFSAREEESERGRKLCTLLDCLRLAPQLGSNTTRLRFGRVFRRRTYNKHQTDVCSPSEQTCIACPFVSPSLAVTGN